MKAYVGQTRAKELIERLQALGIGECTCRGQLPPRRTPWFYDNGAFTDWKADRPFDITRFSRDVWRITTDVEKGLSCPDFIVVPDLVAAGSESLRESNSWLTWLADRNIPLYLAVQDGMQSCDVAPLIENHNYSGIFVGGTVKWKRDTALEWCELADFMEVPCHIGRVGTSKKVKWAASIGASSIDSSFPLWTMDNLQKFIDALEEIGND
jgi:hypothetical protein